MHDQPHLLATIVQRWACAVYMFPFSPRCSRIPLSDQTQVGVCRHLASLRTPFMMRTGISMHIWNSLGPNESSACQPPLSALTPINLQHSDISKSCGGPKTHNCCSRSTTRCSYYSTLEEEVMSHLTGRSPAFLWKEGRGLEA